MRTVKTSKYLQERLRQRKFQKEIRGGGGGGGGGREREREREREKERGEGGEVQLCRFYRWYFNP